MIYNELIGIFIKQLLENIWFSNFIAYIFVNIEQIGGLLFYYKFKRLFIDDYNLIGLLIFTLIPKFRENLYVRL